MDILVAAICLCGVKMELRGIGSTVQQGDVDCEMEKVNEDTNVLYTFHGTLPSVLIGQEGRCTTYPREKTVEGMSDSEHPQTHTTGECGEIRRKRRGVSRAYLDRCCIF